MATTQVSHDYPPVTAESIARARAAQQAERDRVFFLTGLRVVDKPVPHGPLYLIHCSHCTYRAWGTEEQQAMGRLANHLANVHIAPVRRREN